MDQGEGKVLEEEETQELAHPDVGPASVHQQEALQVTELSEGVVAGHDGLHPLLTADPHADVCSWRETEVGGGRELRVDSLETRYVRKSKAIFIHALTLDHVHVVGSVSDGQRHGLLVLLHQAHHVGLLLRRDAAADDGLTLAGHVHKVNLQTHNGQFNTFRYWVQRHEKL